MAIAVAAQSFIAYQGNTTSLDILITGVTTPQPFLAIVTAPAKGACTGPAAYEIMNTVTLKGPDSTTYGSLDNKAGGPLQQSTPAQSSTPSQDYTLPDASIASTKVVARISYTPGSGFSNTTDTFTVVATDGTAVATATITVNIQ